VARSFRTLSLRAAILALGLVAVGSTAVHAADAARNFDARNAADLAARRHDRHFGRYIDRSLPSYYARPVYYGLILMPCRCCSSSALALRRDGDRLIRSDGVSVVRRIDAPARAFMERSVRHRQFSDRERS
jgi:hypothetical protein